MRVVATAGHVDHGKSSLVLALTGTDPDRLAAEKARGLTIDLGFAFTTLPSGEELAFVDVPGHVRFLKNMLAGVGAVEAAVLVVAANEGWKPQSQEHLAILDLLGVRHGVVVLSKADAVDDDTLELARLEVAERLEGSTFSPHSVVACDSKTGRGLDELRLSLDAMLKGAPLALDLGRPRLWVDRVFAAKGAGTVVTGTLAGGSLTLDMELVTLPGRQRVRIRRIERSNRDLTMADPGSRVALNLVGVDHTRLARGHALVVPDQWAVSSVVDVAVVALPGSSRASPEQRGGLRPLLGRGRYKAYLGSGEHDAVLRALDDSGRFARIRFAAVLPLAPGDRFVLRDPGREETIGGAEVLDVAPPGRARAAPARLDLALGPRLLAGRPWLRPAELARFAGLDDRGAAALVGELVRSGIARRAGEWIVASAELERVLAGVADLVADHHRRAPLEPGLELSALSAALSIEPVRLRAALEGSTGLVVDQGRVRLSSHRPRVSDDPEVRRLLAALEAAPFSPPAPGELAVDPRVVRSAVREGLATSLDGILFVTTALDEARRRIDHALRERGTLTVGEVRDLLGASRRYTLAILSWLDREGFTRRRGDDRIRGPRAGA